MKKFLKFFIPLIILGATAYAYRAPLETELTPLWYNAKSLIFPTAPCAEPIPYILGTFDTKFSISKSYFLSALADAEAIWEKPFGKQLFIYVPGDSAPDALKINLIYDYRQQATSKLNNLGITVKDTQASYDELKAKYTSLQQEITVAKNDYATSRSEEERQRINGMVDEINALVVAINRLATTLNLSVDKYNTINGARGESFEEGVYSSEGINRQIDIYEFSDRPKLVRVLAHELGHALGLEHVADPKAIMYELNQGNNETLTKADLDALKVKCQTK